MDEIALLNTGRVIRDVDAHILAVIEAEDRLALKTFDRFVLDRANDELPQGQRKEPYTSVMLIGGPRRSTNAYETVAKTTSLCWATSTILQRAPPSNHSSMAPT